LKGRKAEPLNGKSEFDDQALFGLRDEGKGLNTLTTSQIRKCLLERNVACLSKEKKEVLLSKLNSYLENK